MYLRIKCSMALVCIITVGSACVAQDDPQEMFMEAQSASQSGDYQKAIEILRKLEEQTPDNPGVVFMLGYNLHASGNLDEAIKYHEKASGDDRFGVVALYNLACAYSLKKQKDKAFDYLEKSIKAGYTQPDQIEHAKSDPDFNNIKDDPRFAEMIAMMENGGKKPDKNKLTKKDLYGTWKVTSGMKAGVKSEDSRLPTIKIDEKNFTIPGGEEETFVMSYKLDMDAKPITVDFKIESGPVPEGQAKGILKFENEELFLCYDPNGEERPAEFVSTEENKCYLFKMKRQKTKPEGIAGQILGKWKCVKGMRAGAEVADDRMASVITIDEKLIFIPVGPDEAFEMSYKIDDSKSPASIDMKIESGPAPEGAAAVGIIKMEDGKVVLCYDPNGVDRPDKFDSTEENGRFLFEMEPAK